METGQAIRGQFIETQRITSEERRWCEEELERQVPPEELERSLAKLAIQFAMENSFTPKNHVTCALPERPGRSWYGEIKKVRHQKFGTTEGFDPAGYEIEAICQDLDTVIWPLS